MKDPYSTLTDDISGCFRAAMMIDSEQEAHVTPVDLWKVAFDKFIQLSPLAKGSLKNYASRRMVDRGSQEVGSSDINHELFALYNMNNKSWTDTILFCVDNPIEY